MSVFPLPHTQMVPKRSWWQLVTRAAADVVVLDSGPAFVGAVEAGWRRTPNYGRRWCSDSVQMRRHGGVARSAWVATTTALFYVNPNLGRVQRWPWSAVVLEDAQDTGGTARIRIRAAGQPAVMALAPRAAQNLMAIAARLEEAPSSHNAHRVAR